MAEETPTVESLSGTEEATTKATNAFSLLGSMTDTVRSQLTGFSEKVNSVKNNFDQNQRTLDNQTTAFGLLSTAILGTRKSFDNLSGIDTSSLNTFSDQVTYISDFIRKDTALGTMAEKSLALAKALGVPTDEAKKGFDAVINYANALAESASNAQKLENAYIQLGARTGSLNDIYAASGTGLKNINLLVERQQKLITDSAAATGVASPIVEQYYSMLGGIPQALNATVKGADGTANSVNMLTATMQLAAGSGRKYADIVEDLKTAFDDYNITGDKALQFTARIGEISNKYGIELDSVRSALRGTAFDFRLFGNEAEGAASLMNQYVGSLKGTGISGNVAIDIVKNMTGGIKELTIAQKGFLSAQTGGPGGLMGAFQIEKELREGKLDKVFDRVRQTMSKEFGKIVSLEEASQSQAAAAQLTKQIMVLKQGPLGQFAKTDQEAIRVLESFKATEKGVPTAPLSETVSEDVQKVGVDINKKSYTELTRIRTLIESARGSAAIANKSFFQDSFAAGTGQENPEVDAAAGLRDNLSQYIKQSSKLGAVAASEASGATTGASKGLGAPLINKTGQSVAETIGNVGTFVKELPEAVNAPVSNVKRLFNQNRNNELLEEDNKKKFMETASQQANQATSPVGDIIDTQDQNKVGGLNQATKTALNIVQKENSKTEPVGTVVPTTVNNNGEVNGQITVHVEGFCLDCGEKIKGSNQSFAVNTAQRAKK